MSKVPHDSARGHVTGTADYIDDRKPVAGEVFVDVFYSPVAHGKIVALETQDALKIPGVLAVYTAKDLAKNKWGSIFHDQPFLAETEVNYSGEAIAVIAAETRE